MRTGPTFVGADNWALRTTWIKSGETTNLPWIHHGIYNCTGIQMVKVRQRTNVGRLFCRDSRKPIWSDLVVISGLMRLERSISTSCGKVSQKVCRAGSRGREVLTRTTSALGRSIRSASIHCLRSLESCRKEPVAVCRAYCLYICRAIVGSCRAKSRFYHLAHRNTTRMVDRLGVLARRLHRQGARPKRRLDQ